LPPEDSSLLDREEMTATRPEESGRVTAAARARGFGARAPVRHLLAAPSVVWTALFFLAPLGLLVLYSFGTVNLLTYQVGFGWTLSNYPVVFQHLYLDPILRSLAISLIATLGCLLFGFPVAYTIASVGRRLQAVLLLLVMIPFWTSFVVRTYGVYNTISDNGPLYQILHALGLVHGYIHLLFTPVGITIGIVYTYLPLMILPLYVTLERIDPALLGAASDLGASPWRVLTRIVLPLAKPGIIAGCTLVGIPATGEYVIPQILGGNSTLMFGNVVSDQFLVIGNYPVGAAMAVTLTGALLVVLGVLRTRAYDAEATFA
jgi:ABC-type spermidine/putrescine transport system permease subunit I